MENIENYNEITEVGVIKKELWEKIDIIENALIQLDRADIILQHWIQEYSFSQKPDPIAAANFFYGIDMESIEAKQAASWSWDYNYIYKFIEIVFDYIIASKELLKSGLNNTR